MKRTLVTSRSLASTSHLVNENLSHRRQSPSFAAGVTVWLALANLMDALWAGEG
jgi:hypothetical protein